MKKLFLLSPDASGRRELLFWLLIHLGIPSLLGLSLFWAGPVRINTMLLDMLPRSGQSRAAAEADAILGERTSREAVILAAAPDFENAKKGASALYAEFKNSKDFESASLFFDAPVMDEFRDYLYDYRFVIAGKETRALLESGRAGEIASDALASAFGFFNIVPLDNIEKDPFLLAERRMEEFISSSLLAGGNLALTEDVLAASNGGIWYVLLRVTLAPQAVSLRESQNAVAAIYADAKAVKETVSGLEFYFSGIPFHSYESSSGAQREISIICTVTLIIILVLFLCVFRSPLPVLLSILAAGFSIGLASASALLVFREIHIITFVFGTTLIGTCVDYSVHFFVHWKGNPAFEKGTEIRSHILKSITMSFISTEVCFSVFLLAPFSILRQFAVFSMTGLLSSFLTSLCIYPRLAIPEKEKRRLSFFSGKLFFRAKGFSVPQALQPVFRGILAAVLAGAAVLFLVFNISSVKIENDLSSLYTMSSFMMESEKKAAQVLDYGSSGWYFIVSGANAEETLEHEEILALRLEEEISRGNLGSFLGTSVFIPSVKTQKKTYEAMKSLLPLVPSQFEHLGFPPEFAGSFNTEFAAGEKYCFPRDMPSQAGISNLWIGENDGNYYSCVLPLHPRDESFFRSIAEEFDFVYFVNKAKDIGGDLDTLTKTMLKLFLAAYLAVSILVCFVYSRRDSLKICAIPVFLVLAALAALSANGIPLGFFSVAALVLVFGLGLDYIFYMTGTRGPNSGKKLFPGAGSPGPLSVPKDGGDKRLTLLGVRLSFVTTILSFGALGFSGFMPVHIFGLTVSAGLGSAFIAAMLLRERDD